MTERTPGPWELSGNDIIHIDGVGTRIIVAEAISGDNATCEANARRIVACVNALEGYPTKDIEERGADTVSGLLTALAEGAGTMQSAAGIVQNAPAFLKMQTQNAELLEALEIIRNSCPSGGQGTCGCNGHKQATIACAAIAKGRA